MRIIEIGFIDNLISSALSVGIDNLIIEPSGVRGVDDERKVVILQNGSLPFGYVGLNRLKFLSGKLKAFRARDNFFIEFIGNDFGAGDLNKVADEFGLDAARHEKYELVEKLIQKISDEISSQDRKVSPKDVRKNTATDGVRNDGAGNRLLHLIRLRNKVSSIDHVNSIKFSSDSASLSYKCPCFSSIRAPKKMALQQNLWV